MRPHEYIARPEAAGLNMGDPEGKEHSRLWGDVLVVLDVRGGLGRLDLVELLLLIQGGGLFERDDLALHLEGLSGVEMVDAVLAFPPRAKFSE